MASARTFRLQQVLEYRQQVEELKNQELAVLAQQRQIAEEALQLLHRQAEEQRDTLARQDAAGRLDPARRQRSLAYIEHVETVIVSQRDVCAALEERVQESRAQLVEVKKDTRMLERLRERRLAEIAREADRRATAEADDLTSQRFIRASKEA